jgi:hypothetical protein
MTQAITHTIETQPGSGNRDTTAPITNETNPAIAIPIGAR